MLEHVSMQWIKNATTSPYFFSEESMRYFNSRLPKGGLRNGSRVFFWTSEQCTWAGDRERRFTLRKLDLTTGHIDTVGEFQQYADAAQARDAVRRAALNQLDAEAAA